MRYAELEYTVDGNRYVGHLAVDDGRAGRRPAVLVCHEGSGMSDHARGAADRLAGLGYVAFALDYLGDGKQLPRDEIGAKLGPLMGDPERIRRLAQAGLDILLDQPEADPARVAAIGYCFGGTMSLELARGGAPVHCVVGFHSGLQTARPEDAANITGTVLVQIGADDPLIPSEQRAAFEAEMRAGGVDWRMMVYGGAVHSFTNIAADALGIASIAYHEPSDRRSWRAMLDLFEEKWGSP